MTHAARASGDSRKDLLRPDIPDGVGWTQPSGGFVTWLRHRSHVDSAELAERAIGVRVAVVPRQPFFSDSRGHRNSRLSYSRAVNEELSEEIRRPARLLRG